MENSHMKVNSIYYFLKYCFYALGMTSSFYVNAKPVHTTIEDPYQWLEEVQSEKALAWVRERNAVSTSQLQALPVFKDNRDKVLSVLDNRDQIPNVSQGWLFL